MSLNDKNACQALLITLGAPIFIFCVTDFCWTEKLLLYLRASYILGKYSTYDEVISGRIWYTAKMWSQRINNIGRAQKMLP